MPFLTAVEKEGYSRTKVENTCWLEDREEEGGSLWMGGQVTEAGQVGKCGTGLWNSVVVDILKAGMGVPLRIRSLQTMYRKHTSITVV